MSTSPPMDRRTFLRGAAGALVALPLLAPRQARAADEWPRRLVVFFHPNGTLPEAWYPAEGSGERDFTLGRIHTPLRRHQQHLIVTQGIHMRSVETGPGEPHQQGMGGVLTGRGLQPGVFVGGDGSLAGWGDGISVDQVIAGRIGRDTRLPSLELGVRVRGSEVRHRLNYAGPANPLPPNEEPHAVYNRLFSDLGTPDGERNRVRLERRSVLDTVRKQFAAVRGRVSAEDRLKLDAHAELVRDIERRLDLEAARGECAAPDAPPVLDPNDERHMAPLVRLQIDLLVAALACDQTRVATLQNSSGANNIRFPHLESYEDDHTLSHAGPSDANAREHWIRRQTWYAEQLAYLLDGLRAVPEGDGTLLDHTVVLWCSEIAVGNTHSHDDMPFLLAGSGGGYFRTGRYLRLPGASHNDLLLTLLHAFGVEAETFGDPRFSRGPLGALTG